MRNTGSVLALVITILGVGCADNERGQQAELETDILLARTEYEDTLRQFWDGTESDSIELHGHLAAYAVNFGENSDPEIVDAIIDDLRAQQSRYTIRYDSSFGRHGVYRSLIHGLPRQEAIRQLTKWIASDVYQDRLWADSLLEDLDSYKVNKEDSRFYHFENRKADTPPDKREFSGNDKAEQKSAPNP